MIIGGKKDRFPNTDRVSKASP